MSNTKFGFASLQQPYSASPGVTETFKEELLGIGGGVDLSVASFLRDHCGGDPVTVNPEVPLREITLGYLYMHLPPPGSI